MFISLYLYGYLLWLVKANYENAGYLNEKLCDKKASFIRMTLLSLQFYLQPPWLDLRNFRSRKWSVCKGIWQSKQFLEYHVNQLRTPSQEIFCKSIHFKIKYCEKFHYRLRKMSLHYETANDQRLTAFHQLFSWTSAGPSKCPIDKMIGSQGHLTVWRVPWLPYVQAKSSITENIFQMNNFSNYVL